MSAALRHPIMKIEDFLAWEARQETKFEFDGFEPVAMTGGSFRHGAIQRNLAIFVGGRLRGMPCQFFGSDVKVLSSEAVRYPDGQVICGPISGRATFTTGPVVLFEVVSPEGFDQDHVVKAAEYKRIPTLQRYVILEQHEILATVWERSADGWRSFTAKSVDALDMPEIGIAVSMAELYEGVEEL